MLQFGNLAMVCANRPDVALVISNGMTILYVGDGPGRKKICIDWQNNDIVSSFIHELNHGSLQKEVIQNG